jgi:hypothetical protein
MRKFIAIGIVGLLVVMGLAYYFLLKKPQMVISKEQINELIQQINAAPNGVKISVDPSNVQITAQEDGSLTQPRYNLTFNKGEFVFDTAVLKQQIPDIPIVKIPIKTENIVMRYGPLDQYLALESAKDLKIVLDLAKLLQDMGEAKNESIKGELTFQAGQLDLGKYNISPVLDKQIKDSMTLLFKILEANASSKSNASNVAFKMSFNDGKQDSLVSLTVDNITANQNINPLFFKLFQTQPNQKVDFTLLTKQGTPPQAIASALNGVKGTMKFDKEGDISFTIGSVSASQTLEPSTEQGKFKGGIQYAIKDVNLKTNAPEDKKQDAKRIEELAKVKELNLKLSLDRLSTSLIELYTKMMYDNTLEGKTEQEKQAAMTGYGMQLMGELMQSKPIIAFSISPLSHALFKLDASGSFEFAGQMLPEGSATATLYEMAKLKDSFQKSGIFSESEMAGAMTSLEQFFIKDDNGNGLFKFEIHANPPQILVNGQPIAPPNF